ncbi:hypothetical protein KYY02_21990 [Streptomyces pimonensis]|uniref:Uncharacterized protein n=1 Tax=Streptomyces pimonensis TaxID=2860288 RepID=A0ABV4J2W5_9ACTN
MTNVASDIEAGEAVVSGTGAVESTRLKALKKENAEPKRANEILKTSASFFAAELDRPHTPVAFIDAAGRR